MSSITNYAANYMNTDKNMEKIAPYYCHNPVKKELKIQSETQKIIEKPLKEIAENLNKHYKIKLNIYDNFDEFSSEMNPNNKGFIGRYNKKNVIHMIDIDTLRHGDNTLKMNNIFERRAKNRIFINFSINPDLEKIIVNKNIIQVNPKKITLPI